MSFMTIFGTLCVVPLAWCICNIWHSTRLHLVGRLYCLRLSSRGDRRHYVFLLSVRACRHSWPPRRRLPVFYRAMLCIRGTSHGPVSVRPSVCPSQVGVLSKRMNESSWFLASELPSTRPTLC